MNGVAPKIAQEIGMFFQHEDRHASARQKKAEHHSSRAAAGDDAARLEYSRIHAVNEMTVLILQPKSVTFTRMKL